MKTVNIMAALKRSGIKFSLASTDPQMEDDCINITGTNMHVSNHPDGEYCAVVTEDDGFLFEDVTTVAQIVKILLAA